MTVLLLGLDDDLGWGFRMFAGSIVSVSLLVGTCTGMACLCTSGYRLIWYRETEWTGEWRDYGGYW